MARRSDPERVYTARRAATFAKLTQTGAVDELKAEHRITAWEISPEAQALDPFTQGFWQEADRWLAKHRW